MSPKRTRRALLAGLAGLSVAGCATDRTPPTPDAVTTDWAIPGVDQGRTNYLAARPRTGASAGE